MHKNSELKRRLREGGRGICWVRCWKRRVDMIDKHCVYELNSQKISKNIP